MEILSMLGENSRRQNHAVFVARDLNLGVTAA